MKTYGKPYVSVSLSLFAPSGERLPRQSSLKVRSILCLQPYRHMDGDQELIICQLMSMGYELEDALLALERTGMLSFDAALDFLLDRASEVPLQGSVTNPGKDVAVRAAACDCSSPGVPQEEAKEEAPGTVPDEELSRSSEQDSDWSDGDASDNYREDALQDLQAGRAEEELIELVRPDYRLVLDSSHFLAEVQKIISDSAEMLQLSFGEAARLLQKFRWNQEGLYNQFLTDPQKVTSVKGKRETPANYDRCQICERVTELFAVDCGHAFCRDDWSEHIETKLRNNLADQISCMQAQCPCLVVDSDFVKRVTSPAVYRNFQQFVVQRVVDTHPFWKRCPAPGCSNVLKLDGSRKDVRCGCNFPVCTLCGLESHVPCTCEQLQAWDKKNKSESESVNWILVNTQMCPKCKWPIEKNGGCNHMTCRQCSFEFCWICRGNWSHHTSCNAFPSSSEAKKLEQTKETLDRYIHHYQRSQAHERSKQLDTNLRQSAVEQMVGLCEKLSVSNTNLEIISKATENVIECRRVLKYTYVFGFYYTGSAAERQLFEFLQAELERSTEELSGLLESRLGMDRLDEVRAKSNTASM